MTVRTIDHSDLWNDFRTNDPSDYRPVRLLTQWTFGPTAGRPIYLAGLNETTPVKQGVRSSKYLHKLDYMTAHQDRRHSHEWQAICSNTIALKKKAVYLCDPWAALSGFASCCTAAAARWYLVEACYILASLYQWYPGHETNPFPRSALCLPK